MINFNILTILGSGLTFAVLLYSIYILYFGDMPDYQTLSMALTYSLLCYTEFCELIQILSLTEENLISFERISQYF